MLAVVSVTNCGSRLATGAGISYFKMLPFANQAFYESTRGRYGLDVDTLMSNGPFYVSIWNNDTSTQTVSSNEVTEQPAFSISARCA